MIENPFDKRLREIRERCEAATEGPWRVEEFHDRHIPGVFNGVSGYDGWYEEPDEDDAAFIAAAREDVPWLLEELKKARAEVEKWVWNGS